MKIDKEKSKVYTKPNYLEEKKDYIIDLYRDEKKSIREISMSIGCSVSGIRRIF